MSKNSWACVSHIFATLCKSTGTFHTWVEYVSWSKLILYHFCICCCYEGIAAQIGAVAFWVCCLQDSVSLALFSQPLRQVMQWHSLLFHLPVFSVVFPSFLCCELLVAGLSLVYSVPPLGLLALPTEYTDLTFHVIYNIIIIIIIINCNCVVTQWQWLFYMYTNIKKKKVTRKFKSGGLHEKHVVATWKLGNHLSFRL